MRCRYLGLGLLSLAVASPAVANTIVFGTPTFIGSTSLAGNAADRSATHTASGAGTGTVNFRGQASADHGITTNPTAIADITVTYDVPYTVTRTITTQGCTSMGGPPCGPAEITIPIQTITLNMTYSGAVDTDSSQSFGGLANAVAFTATVQSLGIPGAGIVWGSGNYAGASQNAGNANPAAITFNRTTPDFSYGTSVNFTGPGAGEISFAFQIPTDYQDWEDFIAPQAAIYNNDPFFVQSFTDTIRVSFRLRAESRPSGSVSATGGEAIACAGQSSPLGGFSANPNCGSGFTIAAGVSQTGSVTQPVPEPSTLVMIGGALAGLAYFGRRIRRS